MVVAQTGTEKVNSSQAEFEPDWGWGCQIPSHPPHTGAMSTSPVACQGAKKPLPLSTLKLLAIADSAHCESGTHPGESQVVGRYGGGTGNGGSPGGAGGQSGDGGRAGGAGGAWGNGGAPGGGGGDGLGRQHP